MTCFLVNWHFLQKILFVFCISVLSFVIYPDLIKAEEPVKQTIRDLPETMGSSSINAENTKSDENTDKEQEKIEKDETNSEGASVIPNTEESFSAKMFDDTPESVEQPVYPGVKNLRIEQEAPGKPSIKIYYPSFGKAVVDDAMKSFVEGRIENYKELIGENDTEPAEKQTESQEESDDPLDNPSTWELTGFFTIEKPAPNVVSVLFNMYAYTGGAHGNLWLSALNYNLENQKQILFADLFREPEKALELLSSISIEKLRKIIGDDTDDEWLERGAGPEEDNFGVITLVANGLYVEFQPYQVGPWAIGPQRVFVSLDDLASVGPSPKVWNISSVPVPKRPEPEEEQK